MRPLAISFDEGLFRYTQVERREDVAIFEQQHKPSGHCRYEVVRIHQLPHTWPDGSISPEHEAYPTAREWGRFGWTFFALAAAQQKMGELLQSKTDDPQESAAVELHPLEPSTNLRQHTPGAD